jgi:RNA polymerase sigma-70 factor (ECF subfamily)
MGPFSPGQPWFIDRVREHQARLRASIRALGVRADAVDDIAQDVFVLAWQKLGEFDPESDFGAWVAEIARRLVANERRKETRRCRILAGEVTDLMLRLAPQEEGGTAGLERDEELTALRTCLGNLPTPDREVITLRYFEGLLPGAIAGRLSQQSNAIRQRLLRLRRMLLECVERRLKIVHAKSASG